jgi:hypothetical protein
VRPSWLNLRNLIFAAVGVGGVLIVVDIFVSTAHQLPSAFANTLPTAKDDLGASARVVDIDEEGADITYAVVTRTGRLATRQYVNAGINTGHDGPSSSRPATARERREAGVPLSGLRLGVVDKLFTRLKITAGNDESARLARNRWTINPNVGSPPAWTARYDGSDLHRVP